MTVLIYYVHYKTDTKIEIKKGWEKDETNYFKNILFINGKKHIPAPQWIVLHIPWGVLHPHPTPPPPTGLDPGAMSKASSWALSKTIADISDGLGDTTRCRAVLALRSSGI